RRMASDLIGRSEHRRKGWWGGNKPTGHGEVFRLEKCRVEQLRLVAGAIIAQQGHDGVARTQLFAKADGAGDVDTRRSTHAQPFFLQQLEADRHRFLVGDEEGMIDGRCFDVFGDPALANTLGDRGTLGLQLAGLVVAVERPPRYVAKGNLPPPTPGLEPVGNAPQRAARTDSGHKAVDLATGIGPDFLGSGFDVSAPVGRVVPLVGPDGAIRFALGQREGEPLRIVHVVVLIFVGPCRHLHELGSQQAQSVLFLAALGLGNNNNGAITQGVADHGQPDAGIAGGTLNNRPTRPQRSAGNGILDDIKCRAVFDGLAWVHELGLAQDRTACLLGSAPQLDERRTPNRGGHAIGELQGPDLLLAVLGWMSLTLKMGTRPRKGEPVASCAVPQPQGVATGVPRGSPFNARQRTGPRDWSGISGSNVEPRSSRTHPE